MIKFISAIILISFIQYCTLNLNRDITGTWKSISIENPSPIFSEVLPSYEKGEIVLTFYPTGIFNWKNYKEKLNLNGKYSFSQNTLFFNAENAVIPVKAEFMLKGNSLVLKTDDRFTFTFIKSP